MSPKILALAGLLITAPAAALPLEYKWSVAILSTGYACHDEGYFDDAQLEAARFIAEARLPWHNRPIQKLTADALTDAAKRKSRSDEYMKQICEESAPYVNEVVDHYNLRDR